MWSSEDAAKIVLEFLCVFILSGSDFHRVGMAMEINFNVAMNDGNKEY